jgi:hypothetical protein
MDISGVRRASVMVLGAVLVVAGAGFAAARTQGGPPWAQQEEPTCDVTVDPTCVEEEVVEEEIDVARVRAEVEEFFGEFENECGTELLGAADLEDVMTLEAFDALVTAYESGQTSHGVQGIRSVLRNCEDHVNDGLRNALYHHGINWQRHYEHEQWLQEKFENRSAGGHPGNGHGNPHTTETETETDGGPGNGHGGGSSNGHGGGNGNAFGHNK